VLTPGAKGMKGAIAKAEELAVADPAKYVLMKQFENPPIPRSTKDHGPRDLDDTGGGIDVFVSGVAPAVADRSLALHQGTRGKKILTVAVEPRIRRSSPRRWRASLWRLRRTRSRASAPDSSRRTSNYR